MPYSDTEQEQSTSSLQLHGYWRSGATYRVRIALHLKNIDFEYIPVNIAGVDGEQHSDGYSKLNSAKLVPTLVDVDADIQLNQSLAIIEYLDERYDSGVKLIPSHRIERARARALAMDMACDVQPLANLRVLNKLRQDYDLDDAGVQAWAQHWMRTGLTATEKKLARKAGKFALGFDVSIVDVVLVPQIYSAIRFGIDVKAEFPLLFKIYTHCNELEAFKLAAPEQQVDAQ